MVVLVMLIALAIRSLSPVWVTRCVRSRSIISVMGAATVIPTPTQSTSIVLLRVIFALVMLVLLLVALLIVLARTVAVMVARVRAVPALL